MDQPQNRRNRGGISLRIALGILFVVGLPLFLLAESTTPSWWSNRGVTNSNAGNDYAAVNQGQVKNIAVKAVAELDANLPGGAGDILHTLATNLSGTTATTNDYAAVNLGQLKNLSKPFLDRLLCVGYQGHPLESGTYPWLSGSANPANDYAMANIGQVKNLFSFDLTLTGTNGLPDWWQNYYFGGSVPDPNVLAPSGVFVDGSAVTILQAYQNKINPIDFYDGQAPNLIIVGGNNQIGTGGIILPLPLTVQVSRSGAPLKNAPVTFTSNQNDGLFSTSAQGLSTASQLTLRADSNGLASIYYIPPSTGNIACLVTASAGQGTSSAAASLIENTGDDTVLPVAPENLVAVDNPDGSIDFTWDDMSNNESYFFVEKQQPDGSWKRLFTAPANTTSYHYVPNQ